MFKPPDMKRIRLLLPADQEERFMNDVSELGILQIEKIEGVDARLGSDDPGLIQESDRLEALIKRCDAVLNRLPKEGIIELLVNKGPVEITDEGQESRLCRDAEQILGDIEGDINKFQAQRPQPRSGIQVRSNSTLNANMAIQQKGASSQDHVKSIDGDEIKYKLLGLKSALTNRLRIITARESVARSQYLALLEGWAREKDVGALTSLLERGDYDHRISIRDPQLNEMDEVPVTLDNPPFINSFESITSMFGYPKYGQIDPTPILALTFTIFFGLMFADAFDGLLLLIFSLLLYRGLGSKSINGRKMSEILIAVSISAIFFGILTGEFMGGMVNLPILWFNGFQDTMYFIEVAIIIAIIQITIGLVIGTVNELLRKRVRKAIGDKASWLLLLYGVIVIFLHYYYLQDVTYMYLGSLLSISGLALLMATNLMNIVEITRLISNVVSYTRIVAISMSHIGIARAFVLLVSPLTSPGYGALGIVVGGTLLVVAHLFIVFIESFVVFAHSLRLQFVEFFSKFFEPAGNVFLPLARVRGIMG